MAHGRDLDGWRAAACALATETTIPPSMRILLHCGATLEDRTALRRGPLLAKRLEAESRLLPVFDCFYWARGYNVVPAISFGLDE